MFLLLNHGISNIIHSGVTGITSKNVSIQNHLVLELLRIKLVATMKKELQVLHFMHQIGKFGLDFGFGVGFRVGFRVGLRVGFMVYFTNFCLDKSVVRMAKSKVLGLVEKTTPDLMLRKKCCEKSIFGQFDF